MKKRIGILTQPLVNNYGGILQAYALTKTLTKLGYDPEIINRKHEGSRFWKLRAYIKKLFLNKKTWTKITNDISNKTLQFVSLHIPCSKEEFYSHNIKKINSKNYYAIIVGSDQVWRPKYSPCIGNYFLDFCEKNFNVKKVAYSASFGVSDWEFTPEDTAICTKLIDQFDAISVREDSALSLCHEYLGVDNVMQTLDPTLLLNKNEYAELISHHDETLTNNGIMYYILDMNNEKQNIVRKIETILNINSFSVMPKKLIKHFSDYDEKQHLDFIFPSVTQWLKGIMDAKFVVTDSFHGVVFSIIFNKPFIVIANKDRGLARFTSLLKDFDLEHRLIFSSTDLDKVEINYLFDWEKINAIKEHKCIESINFLKTVLK